MKSTACRCLVPEMPFPSEVASTERLTFLSGAEPIRLQNCHHAVHAGERLHPSRGSTMLLLSTGFVRGTGLVFPMTIRPTLTDLLRSVKLLLP
jgi:hypothetical protein